MHLDESSCVYGSLWLCLLLTPALRSWVAASRQSLPAWEVWICWWESICWWEFIQAEKYTVCSLLYNLVSSEPAIPPLTCTASTTPTYSCLGSCLGVSLAVTDSVHLTFFTCFLEISWALFRWRWLLLCWVEWQEKKRADCQDMLFLCQSEVKVYGSVGQTTPWPGQQAANVRVCGRNEDHWWLLYCATLANGKATALGFLLKASQPLSCRSSSA